LILSTTLATALLGGLVAAGSVPAQPAWQNDYGKALVQSANLKKPIAVFIAQGGEGYTKLVKDGTIPADAAKLLGQSYVCLYVDAATPAGKEVAESFRMTRGLVLSNKGGTQQALRIEGQVSQSELTGYLTRYAGASQVAQTEFAGASQPSAAPANQYPVIRSSCPNGNCGSCPNGNCYRYYR